MTAYRVGSMGPEVQRIQTVLQQQGFYAGALDGVFGGATEAAVRAFQKRAGLDIDGIVGAQTWAQLFPAAPAVPAPSLGSAPLDQRCLALTASFETSTPPPDCFAGITGDFDGMGLSFGALQWNLGSGSLQPLLTAFDTANKGVIDDIFGSRAAEFRSMLSAPISDQLEWARSIQSAKHVLIEPWLGYFKTLGRNSAFIAMQTNEIAGKAVRARSLCAQLGVVSERAVALAFDIITQNGGIAAPTMETIKREIAELPAQPDFATTEQAKLEIIANRRADAAKAAWREDVRKRKLTIAQGSGEVHGRFYDLAGQYGITLSRA